MRRETRIEPVRHAYPVTGHRRRHADQDQRQDGRGVERIEAGETGPEEVVVESGPSNLVSIGFGKNEAAEYEKEIDEIPAIHPLQRDA